MGEHDMRLHTRLLNTETKRRLRLDPEYRKRDSEARKRYYRTHKDVWTKGQFRRKYGITIEQYQEMFVKQNGNCAICFTHQLELKQKLAVDHCHITGLVRGLLCDACNRTIGHAKENPARLRACASYLERDKK